MNCFGCFRRDTYVPSHSESEKNDDSGEESIQVKERSDAMMGTSRQDAVNIIKHVLARQEEDMDDLGFIVLAKIYTQKSAVADLRRLDNRTLKHLTPFILNMLLYGQMVDDEITSPRDKNTSFFSSVKQISTAGSNKSGPKVTLNTTDALTQNEKQKELENFMYETCMKSVDFALNCSWYFTASLTLGPQSIHHRTMTYLLGLETAITNNELPGSLYSKAIIAKKDTGQGLSDTADEIIAHSPPAQHTNHIRKPSVQVGLAGAVLEDSGLFVDVTGDGTEDLHLRAEDITGNNVEKLQNWLDAHKERKNFFHAEMDFVKCLTNISYELTDIPRERRKEALRKELSKLNEFLPRNVYIPTEFKMHKILKTVPEDCHVFSTKERSPYLLTIEVQDLHASKIESPPSSSLHLRRKKSGKNVKKEVSADIAEAPNQPDENFEYVSTMIEEHSTTDNRPENEHETSLQDLNANGAFGESFLVKQNRLQKSSEYGSLPGWRLLSVIVKARDNLRQEMFAQRLIQEFYRIFRDANLNLWLKPYQILATSADSGFIEALCNAKSIDSIKKDFPNFTTLNNFFTSAFGEKGTSSHKASIKNFVESMAGYSVVSYVLQFKDRHNGNLMLNNEGHLIHIDFGFLLSNSPGGNMEFEKAPFKLTTEMIEVMGGVQSSSFRYFRKLCCQGYAEACKHRRKFALLVDSMFPGNEDMPCFLQGRNYVIQSLEERLMPHKKTKERYAHMNELINVAANNWTTRWYDRYQKVFTGIH